jgi:hypothetical protein
MNCDDRVDGGDIAPFVTALIDPVGFAANSGGCDIFHADADDNGSIELADVNAFTDLLLTSGS